MISKLTNKLKLVFIFIFCFNLKANDLLEEILYVGEELMSSIHILTLQTLTDNFHVVSEERCYRSKQLTPERLQHYIEQYELKTIVNLRDDIILREFYDEKIVCEKYGIDFVSIPFSPYYIPQQEILSKIINTIQTAKLPILIHCKGGRDRTGLFCALWKLEADNVPAKEAIKQLSIKYGHLELLRPNMKRCFMYWQELRNNLKIEEALENYKYLLANN